MRRKLLFMGAGFLIAYSQDTSLLKTVSLIVGIGLLILETERS